MIFKINQEGDKHEINVQCNRLTLVYSEELKEQVKPLLSNQNACVTINLSGVKFIDSSGVGSLIALAKQAKISGSKLYITNIEEGVKELFTLLRLDTIFNIYNTTI